MIENYIHVMKKCLDFNGRSSVREYWKFVLMHFIIWGLLIAIISIVDLGQILNMSAYVGYPLLGFVPQLAATIRRLHDTNRSGWWIILAWFPLINILIIVFLAQSGNTEANIYGHAPIN